MPAGNAMSQRELYEQRLEQCLKIEREIAAADVPGQEAMARRMELRGDLLTMRGLALDAAARLLEGKP